jgi:hypothetical protein
MKLIKIYLKKTQSRKVTFLERREEILGEIKTRSKKYEVRGEKWKHLMLVFISLKKIKPLSKTAIDTCVRKLFNELNLTIDYLGRSFTPGGLRKTRKNLVKEAGFSK